jgi:cell division protein FtsQ
MTPDRTAVADRPTIDPRIRQRRVAVERGRARRRRRWLLGTVVVVVVAVGGWALLHTPLFSARVVTVTGSHPHTPDAAIVAAAGLTHHTALISMNAGAVAGRVEALPYVATARVARHWPDRVTIAVTERVPAVTMAGPGSSWSILDGAGRTLAVDPTRPTGLVVLIVHTAAAGVPPAPVGGSLPVGATSGLVVCRTLPPAFATQVVSVTEAPDGTVDLALNSGLTVSLGTDVDLRAKYEDLAAIIAHGDLHGVTTIDLTVPQSPTTGS